MGDYPFHDRPVLRTIVCCQFLAAILFEVQTSTNNADGLFSKKTKLSDIQMEL